ATQEQMLDLEKATDRVLASIDREREREIISRRFGLADRKETLEQIGELLGITRERVRQLEKAILIRLKIAAEDGNLGDVEVAEKLFIRHLHEMGDSATIKDLTKHIYTKAEARQQARVAFFSELAPNLTVLSENDTYAHGVGIKELYADEIILKKKVDAVVKAIKEHGVAISAESLYDKIDGFQHPSQVNAIATLSKMLATLRGDWGLVKWPSVNPKNIRDKIYVILQENKKPLHFSDIAKAIKLSEFKRKDVTTQAIHNELIKDKRFVLIGRGIYALKEWGYSKGTVSDVIADVLKKENGPLHRDEIVKRVLKSRQVRETTILLNLQSKPEFKRVAKATYSYDESLKK
ncbi:hypothetical protein B7Z28_01700, partial [Candidatus Saccharibacteria bacterium 32-45-3]